MSTYDKVREVSPPDADDAFLTLCLSFSCVKANGPALHVIEPSGNSFQFFGAAVGKGRQLARNEIEKLKLGELTCRCDGGG